VPQSNQRGIETLLEEQGAEEVIHTPQSNQRGIETQVLVRVGGTDIRLNRTSVGLKLLSWVVVGLMAVTPQSNQRGIETSSSREISPTSIFASIEMRSRGWDKCLNRTSVGLKLREMGVLP